MQKQFIFMEGNNATEEELEKQIIDSLKDIKNIPE